MSEFAVSELKLNKSAKLTAEELSKQLGANLKNWGASLWGAADLNQVAANIAEDYGDTWQAYPRAISVAVFFPKGIIEQLLAGPTHTYQAYYDIVNDRLNQIALSTTLFLEALGYQAFPVPASQRVGANKEAGIFSHRTAAYLAGLGWIGKSLSLVTKEVGSRVRLVTILTDAPLLCGKPLANACPAGCRECEKACPSQAILGADFDVSKAIETRFNRKACADYLKQVRQSFGKEVCGRCIAACPFSRK